MVLVTGPTGSGKSTTLYASLNKINDVSRNIITVEDPVEYNLPGISQMQANAKIGLTFATGLRTIVRQDPDVIMPKQRRVHSGRWNIRQRSAGDHLQQTRVLYARGGRI